MCDATQTVHCSAQFAACRDRLIDMPELVKNICTSSSLGCSDIPIVKAGLEAMLPSYLARQLQNNKPHEELKTLNSNSVNPYLFWNNGTRGELTKFLEEQRDSAVRRGESDPAFGAEFRYSQHSEELVVGTVYLRIYNSNPTFALENPKVNICPYFHTTTQI